eukprot:12700.XXX_192465_192854_1 [CDS] Oithona nana genome sequencing.
MMFPPNTLSNTLSRTTTATPTMVTVNKETDTRPQDLTELPFPTVAPKSSLTPLMRTVTSPMSNTKVKPLTPSMSPSPLTTHPSPLTMSPSPLTSPPPSPLISPLPLPPTSPPLNPLTSPLPLVTFTKFK